MSLQSETGQSFPPFTYKVEQGKIRELAQALGDRNLIYQSREAARVAGYPDIPVPLTGPTLYTFWVNAQFAEYLAGFGIDTLHMFHREETYEYFSPVYAGDVLTGIVNVVDVNSQKMMDGSSVHIVTLEITYTNQQDQRVVSARSVFIAR